MKSILHENYITAYYVKRIWTLHYEFADARMNCFYVMTVLAVIYMFLCF